MPFDPTVPAPHADLTSAMFRDQFTGLKALIPDPTGLTPLVGPATVDAVAAQLNQMLYVLKAAAPPVYFHKANLPCPANGAINVPITGLEFAWLGGEGNLYFGTVSGTWTGSVIACNSPIDVAAHLGALLPATTYYWQVNIIGGPPGDIWQITTAP
jgi:hypothetical protein